MRKHGSICYHCYHKFRALEMANSRSIWRSLLHIFVIITHIWLMAYFHTNVINILSHLSMVKNCLINYWVQIRIILQTVRKSSQIVLLRTRTDSHRQTVKHTMHYPLSGSEDKNNKCDVWCSDVCFLQSLLLLTYLIRNGSERVVTSTREHLYDLRQLESYAFSDEFGRDQGVNGKASSSGLYIVYSKGSFTIIDIYESVHSVR